jgi:hypothetical protein
MTSEKTVAAIEPGGLRFRYRVEISAHHYGAVFERSR